MHILAGDIGGTKTHLAIFAKGVCLKEEKYHSKNFSSLLEIIQLFLKEPVEKACFAVAGPVENGVCKTTNLPWLIESRKLSTILHIPRVHLINDLEATAWGVLHLKEEEFAVINQGKKHKGNQAIIAAGTGLGEAIIYWDGNRYHPFACEGGHVDFAPRDKREKELLYYLSKKYGHVSYERVVSGMGLENLYHFLKQEEGQEEDLPRMISEKGLHDSHSIYGGILNWFSSLYGAEAGNLALKSMALAGVYVGGGIAPKILKVLQSGVFMEAFWSKGRFKSLLSQIPVKVILNENAALIGAAHFAALKI